MGILRIFWTKGEPKMFTAKDIMSTDLITVKKDTPIYEAIKMMAEKDLTGLLVVDDDLKLLGVVSEKDFLGLIKNPENARERVEDFMTPDPVSFCEDDDLMEICECLMNRNFRRVPIISEGKLVGIISRKDIVRYIAEPEE